MKLEGVAQVMGFDPYTNDTTAAPGGAPQGLGEAVYLEDMRVFRYGKAGGTIAAGKLACAPAPVTNFHNMAMTAAAIGVVIVNVTPGASTGTAGIFNEGMLIINAGTGLGISYKVSSQPTIASATAFNVTLFDPIQVALDATSKGTLVHNAYNLPVTTTTQTLRAAGVPLVATAVNNFCWFQTRGIASVLGDVATAVGNTVVISGSVAGAVAIGSTTYGTFQATTPVGKALVAAVDTEYRPIWLTID